MPLKSRWNIDIPQVSLPTYLFGSPSAPLSDKPILIDVYRPHTHFLTLHGYRLWAKRFAAGLRANGLKPGDRVMLFSGNTIFFPVFVLGVVMAGGIFSGANPNYVAREIAYQLGDTEAIFLVAAEESLDIAIEAAESTGVSKDRVFVFDKGYATLDGNGQGRSGCRHWSALIANESEGERFAWEELSTAEELNRTIALNYSSGTTGVPKGVEITHRNYVSNAVQYAEMSRLNPDYEEKTARARWICILPMYHAYGQTVFCVGGPKRGIPVYVVQKFDFLGFLDAIQKFRITDLTLVPPIAVAMAKHPAVKNYDLSSVEAIGSGAAPLGAEVCRELEKLWPDGKINVKQGWGMTEVTCSLLGWDSREHSESFSVGYPNHNCEVKIMNEDGSAEVPDGERGELWCRGPNVMKGYWKKAEATKQTFSDDGCWLKSGDIAVIDERGRIYIVDRKKELIKVKGNQVAPAELEALLLEHPAVADAAVIGITRDGEEYPRAYVVRQANTNPSEQEIAQFLEKRVTRHKRLTGGVRFLDAIPKNPSGKILRKALRDKSVAQDAEHGRLQAKL